MPYGDIFLLSCAQDFARRSNTSCEQRCRNGKKTKWNATSHRPSSSSSGVYGNAIVSATRAACAAPSCTTQSPLCWVIYVVDCVDEREAAPTESADIVNEHRDGKEYVKREC